MVKNPAPRAMSMLTTSLFVMMTGMIQMQVLFVKSLDSMKEDMQLKNPILVELILRHKVVGTKSSLTECRHESHDDCGNSEGAGVVCNGYRDNSSGK